MVHKKPLEHIVERKQLVAKMFHVLISFSEVDIQEDSCSWWSIDENKPIIKKKKKKKHWYKMKMFILIKVFLVRQIITI